ncbi:MAG: site-determining protein [Planctomycetota bacterium]
MKPVPRQTKTYAIASGKGGVGKTNVAANLAIALSGMGQRVLLFDADLSLANTDLLFGLAASATLEHVIAGRRRLDEIVVQGPEGVDIIPSGSGIAELADLAPERLNVIAEQLAALAGSYDTVLIDVPAGIGPVARRFSYLADEILLVITPEPTSVADAYALAKLQRKESPHGRLRLMVNMAQDDEEARRVAQAFSEIMVRFQSCPVESLGHIPWDANVPEAVRRQQPFMTCYPNCRASRVLKAIGRTLLLQREALAGAQAASPGGWNRLLTWMDPLPEN